MGPGGGPLRPVDPRLHDRLVAAYGARRPSSSSVWTAKVLWIAPPVSRSPRPAVPTCAPEIATPARGPGDLRRYALGPDLDRPRPAGAARCLDVRGILGN